LGLVGVGWAVLFTRWFRNRPEEHPGVNEGELAAIRGNVECNSRVPHSEAWPGLGVLLSSVTVWGMCLASFWVCFGWYVYPTWQPLYLKDVHGYAADDTWSEVLSGLPFLCGAAGCLVGGGLSDRLVRRAGRRWGRSLVGVVGFVGAGLCVLLTGFAETAW